MDPILAKVEAPPTATFLTCDLGFSLTFDLLTFDLLTFWPFDLLIFWPFDLLTFWPLTLVFAFVGSTYRCGEEFRGVKVSQGKGALKIDGYKFKHKSQGPSPAIRNFPTMARVTTNATIEPCLSDRQNLSFPFVGCLQKSKSRPLIICSPALHI